MNERAWELPNEAATLALGEAVGHRLKAWPKSATLFLEGDLGAGKTCFCRGVLRAFGHTGPVKSPTYTLVEVYELEGRTLHHFDLYRLGDPEELEFMGIRDYFGPAALCLVEWPERGAGVLPEADLHVTVTAAGSGRHATLRAATKTGRVLQQDLPTDLAGVDGATS